VDALLLDDLGLGRGRGGHPAKVATAQAVGKPAGGTIEQ
jgi:hypothetical protein